MSSTPSRRLDDVVDERVDPRRARAAEDRDLLARQVVLGEEPVAHRVVDVVVDVRDAVDEPHDLPLERLGLALARVREDPVADLVGEVERARDPQRLLVVAEATTEPLPQSASSSASSPACPNGVWPMSCPSPIASTRSSFSRSARATTREIAVVSSVWVMRVR